MLNINKLYKMDNEEIKEKIKGQFNFQWLQEEVNKVLDTGLNLYLDEVSYISILDIIVPDRAGQFMQKELIEILFNEEIEEKEYKNNYYEYIDFIDYNLFKVTDELLDDNINIPSEVTLTLDYINSDIAFYLIVDIDYIPKQAKKEYIEGIDKHLITNITEGYISKFKSDEENCYKYVYCFFSEDDNKFYWWYIDNFTDEEIKDDFKSLFDKKADDSNILNMLMQDTSYIQEWGFNGTSYNIIELFNDLEVI